MRPHTLSLGPGSFAKGRGHLSSLQLIYMILRTFYFILHIHVVMYAARAHLYMLIVCIHCRRLRTFDMATSEVPSLSLFLPLLLAPITVPI